jgi:hypothetical protein
VDWAQASLSRLFQAKRARALAGILAALRGLERAPGQEPVLTEALRQDCELGRAFRTALRDLASAATLFHELLHLLGMRLAGLAAELLHQTRAAPPGALGGTPEASESLRFAC